MDTELIVISLTHIIFVCVVFAIYIGVKEFLIRKAEKRLSKRLNIDASWRKNK